MILLSALLSAFGNDKVVFYGWDVVDYYYRLFKNFYDGYSWQVRVSYALVVFCTFLMFVLFWFFFFRVRRRLSKKKKYREIKNRYAEAFREVLLEVEPLMPSQVEEICKADRERFAKFNPELFVHLLTEIRQELQEVIFLPNLQVLSQVCGVVDYLEFNLLKGRKVFASVQYVTMLNIRISEGRLANYVNYRNIVIRHMARMGYMISTDMEPYRFLTDDLNEPMAAWRRMMMHQLLGWLHACEKRMPNLLTLVDRVEDPNTAAFVIEEIAYWGSEEERRNLNLFFMDERFECRSAAFKAVAMLRDSDQEKNMMETYEAQPETLRREIMRAVYAVGSGHKECVEFFSNTYHTTASKETREVALTCLYDYSEESRRLFEHLRFENNAKDRTLIDQIDSFNLLNQIRNYN